MGKEYLKLNWTTRKDQDAVIQSFRLTFEDELNWTITNA
jgi:hypothetical protein